MSWWWDSYIHPRDLSRHYTGIDRFLANFDRRTATTTTVRVLRGMDRYRAHALQNGRDIAVWFHNRRDWRSQTREDGSDVVTRYRTRARGGPSSIHLAQPPDHATWYVRYFDPYDGIVVGQQRVQLQNGGLTVPVPVFHHDLAILLTPMDADTPLPELRVFDTPIHRRFAEQLGRQ